MVLLCKADNCKKRASFGIEGETAKYCKTHIKNDMIDVIHPKCIKCKKKRPNFGLEGKKGEYCKNCKTSDMIDVNNIKCIKCMLKQPSYGIDENKATHCFDCKLPNMNDVIHIMCIVCHKIRPTYGIDNKKATHCFNCKLSIMDDVINSKCKTTLCNTRLSNLKYNGYCLRCFIYNYPDNSIVKNYKTKEKLVVDFIRNQFPNNNWKFDKIIQNGTSKKRPDIFINLDNQIIIIEVDENQHQYYDYICENKRLMQLSQDVGHKSIVFIRINPHLASKTRCFATYFLYNKF
jgi:hypothetical protein